MIWQTNMVSFISCTTFQLIVVWAKYKFLSLISNKKSEQEYKPAKNGESLLMIILFTLHCQFLIKVKMPWQKKVRTFGTLHAHFYSISSLHFWRILFFKLTHLHILGADHLNKYGFKTHLNIFLKFSTYASTLWARSLEIQGSNPEDSCVYKDTYMFLCWQSGNC